MGCKGRNELWEARHFANQCYCLSGIELGRLKRCFGFVMLKDRLWEKGREGKMER